jgi:hypothetical protein
MRVAFVFLVACAKIAIVEQTSSVPVTWDEACIQREMECIANSRAGGEMWFIIAPLAVPHTAITGDMITRHCKLQGDLCRTRHGVPYR